MLGLVLGIITTIVARLEKIWLVLAIVPFGVLAAQASNFYTVDRNPGQPAICGVGRVSNG